MFNVIILSISIPSVLMYSVILLNVIIVSAAMLSVTVISVFFVMSHTEHIYIECCYAGHHWAVCCNA
jgi:hypothetical protein